MAVLLLLAACTQDELSSPTGGVEGVLDLPEGQYPLQIGGITLSAQLEQGEASPQTRVTDNGNSSVFQDGDRIGVRIGDSQETGEYRLIVDASGNVTGATPIRAVYWQNTNPATITAWYPVSETVDFTQQDQKLAYLLRSSNGQASYNTPARLTFTHQLAKVRVTLSGSRTSAVSAVTVRSYPTAENDEGNRGAIQGNDQYVPMLKTTYNNQPCWEATLLPGTLQAGNSFRLTPTAGGDPVQATLTSSVSISAGKVYTIDITVNPAIPADAIEITTDNCNNINGTDDYVVRGTFGNSITIAGGSPNIYLDNATVSVGNGNAISITGNASPTIHVVGTDNNVSTSDGAGIYVAQGSSVNIQGSSRNDVLTDTAGRTGAGIGGYYNGSNELPCGNIEIRNTTVTATGKTDYGNLYPGIGSYASCGDIVIDNATVNAYGTGEMFISTPAIGSRQMTPDITITDSEIHAHRGGYNNTSYADWIGTGGAASSPSGQTIQGDIRNSTVYCYTGTSSTTDKTVKYDANGNGTEQ